MTFYGLQLKLQKEFFQQKDFYFDPRRNFFLTTFVSFNAASLILAAINLLALIIISSYFSTSMNSNSLFVLFFCFNGFLFTKHIKESYDNMNSKEKSIESFFSLFKTLIKNMRKNIAGSAFNQVLYGNKQIEEFRKEIQESDITDEEKIFLMNKMDMFCEEINKECEEFQSQFVSNFYDNEEVVKEISEHYEYDFSDRFVAK